MALSPYYSVFEPFTSLTSMPDPFSILGTITEPRGRGRTLISDYPMDIKETDKSFEVYADAPGMGDDEVHVDFNDETRVLTIRGEHTEASETLPSDSKKVYRSERVQRSFMRSFTLPRDLDADAIKASLDRGVLNVHIPKKIVERPAPRRISVAHGAGGGVHNIETGHTTTEA